MTEKEKTTEATVEERAETLLEQFAAMLETEFGPNANDNDTLALLLAHHFGLQAATEHVKITLEDKIAKLEKRITELEECQTETSKCK